MPDFVNILSDQREEILSLDTSQWVSRESEALIDLDSPLAQIVIGVRRSGKSTLCLKRLLESGVNFAYINFDDERLEGLQSDALNDALATLYRINGRFTHLFLDEVQNVSGWPLFVNRLLRQGIHLVLTGSNANLLSGELSTHLTGRYHRIELLPFSYAELCRLRKLDIRSWSTRAMALRQQLLDEYMRLGGLPELHTGRGSESYVPSLMAAVVRRDVCRRYRLRYPDVVWQLANLLLDNFCQEVIPANLADRLGVASVHTVRRYLDCLEEAYLVCRVPRFSYKSVERQHYGRAYAIDPAFVMLRADAVVRPNRGWMLENVIYLELRRRYGRETQQLMCLHHGGFEVDFVVVEAGRVIQLVQVTYDWSDPGPKQIRRELGGLSNGSRLTGCTSLTLVIGEGQSGSVVWEDLPVRVCLATEWLLGFDEVEQLA